MDRRLKRLLQSCCVVTVAFALSWIIAYDFTALSYFASTEKSSDYLASDFYEQIANSRTVKTYEDRIVLVVSDNMNRKDLVELFGAIAAGRPMVTAIDIMFEEHEDYSDTIMVKAIENLGNVVYPIVFLKENVEVGIQSSLYDYIDNGIPGVVNFDVASVRSIIRSFVPTYTLPDGKIIESFALAAVKEFSPEISTIIQNKNKNEIIDFSSSEFDIYSYAEIFENPSILEGKLVFVGELNNFGDMHPTPVSDAMPGVLIHANIAATILSGNYIYPVKRLIQLIISIFLCIILIYAQLSLCDSKAGNMLVRWLQVSILILLIFCGSILYLNYRILLDLTLPLLMVSLGLLAADLCSMLSIIPSNFKKLTQKFMKKNRI